MLCHEFNTRLQTLLDERKSPEEDPLLRDHAHGCSTCHGQLETMAAVLESLELCEPTEPSAGFAERVVGSVAFHHQRVDLSPERRAKVHLPLIAIAAAVLLLAAVPLTWYLARPGEVAVRSAAPPAPSPPVDLHDRSPTPTPPYPDRSSENAGDGWLASSTLLELYPQTTRQRHRRQVNEIADDLRPLAAPLNAAVTAIRRSLPVDQSEPKGEPHACTSHEPPPHVS